MTQSDDDWISQAEAGRLRKVSRQAISKLIAADRLRKKTLGGRTFVSRTEIKSFVPLPAGRKKH